MTVPILKYCAPLPCSSNIFLLKGIDTYPANGTTMTLLVAGFACARHAWSAGLLARRPECGDLLERASAGFRNKPQDTQEVRKSSGTVPQEGTVAAKDVSASAENSDFRGIQPAREWWTTAVFKRTIFIWSSRVSVAERQVRRTRLTTLHPTSGDWLIRGSVYGSDIVSHARKISYDIGSPVR
jgi:hypothetical protein